MTGTLTYFRAVLGFPIRQSTESTHQS